MVHRLVVAFDNPADDGQVGLPRLEDDRALRPAATGAPCHLGEHLEGTLVCSEVALVEELVGIEDAHEGDAVEIEPLGDHLRADEEVGVSALEVTDDAFVGRT